MPRSSESHAHLDRTGVHVPADARGVLVDVLNARLADAFDLYTQTKQAHWNVTGRDFYQLHLLFDQLAETVEEHVDTIAERVTALGGKAKGTARMAAAASSLEEFPESGDGMEFVRALAERYATHARGCREGIDVAEAHDDPATADLLTEVVRDLEKSLYFLEAHLR